MTSALATKACNERVKLWKMMPKLHIFVHLCEWQAVEVGNPRSYWTYADEVLKLYKGSDTIQVSAANGGVAQSQCNEVTITKHLPGLVSSVAYADE